MFDEEYESDQEEDVRMGYKNIGKPNPKALTPTESNMTLSMKQGDELMKLMKERGIDMKESELNRIKAKQPEPQKKLSKAGFFDGGHSAPLEELLTALKKAYTNNDPQQASCILSYILENKGLPAEDRSKFGLMKCNLLFNLAAFEECCDRATELIEKPFNEIAYAQLSNYLAKSKAELNRVWEGYMDLQRAKSLMIAFEGQKKKEAMEDRGDNDEEYVDSELDSILREINHTEMEYNIRVSKEKSTLNLIHPLFSVFRNRRVLSVSAGEYHVLFLVGTVEYDKELKGRWSTEVFGLGENRAGQITGSIEYRTSFNEPVLLKDLSGKGIEGVYACREVSMAYDECGNIYEWGAKANGRHQVELTYSLGEKVKKLQKGNHHYVALTNHSRLFVWGRLEYQEATILNEPKPNQPKIVQPVQFSCGSNYVLVVDAKGELWGIGSNQQGQLCSPGTKFLKEFTKINTSRIGRLSKVYCLFECSFLQTTEQELFYCGRHSYNKEPLEYPKQAEFPDEPKIISVSGHPGSYYATNQYGQAYVWEVDGSVKFKLEKGKDRLSQRIVQCSKGNVYRIKTLPVAKLCTGSVVSKELKTYEPIFVEVSLRDQYGEYGLDLCQPVKYTVHLSRKILKNDEIIEQSEKFLKLTASKYRENKPFLDEIMGSELVVSRIKEQEEEGPSDKHLLEFSVERNGTYYLYLLMDSVLINAKPFELVVETSEKEEQLQRKMQEERERRRQEREAQKEREEQEKRDREEEQQMELERRKETQKRAQETYKLHMRQQEEQRRKQEQDRKRRADLMVGGGFDLSKMKKKASEEPVVIDPNIAEASRLRRKPSDEQLDPNMTSDSFINKKKLDYDNYAGEVPQLPDINMRPSSKRKLVLKKPDGPPDQLLMGGKTAISTVASKNAEFKTAVPIKRGDSRPKK